MIPLSRDDERAVVAEASRAPSVHNIQPTRWRFLADGSVLFLHAADRALPAGDPTGHDVRVSIGAACEGTAIALSRRGLGLGPLELGQGPAGPGLTLVARARLVEGDAEDPLGLWVSERRAYRGRFAVPTPEIVAGLHALAADDAQVITGPRVLHQLARQYDVASLHFLGRANYEAELYRWMRFRPSHPNWNRDGLNAACMAVSAVEARVAELLLHPRVFARIRRLGVVKALVSEARPIRSSAAVILYCPLRSADPFDVGRRFYRLWLEVTAAGCALCPLSALADHPPTATALQVQFVVDPRRRIANAFRVGVAPSEPARSPRLPIDELIV